ncbi:ribbon-helix-helix domain-containing protein [Azorhizobium caulinodans]|uniref:ribbon-helix-helix domain-containing protein n=1 Tax=Azorhizobium caulinodans TaxID=7 RepID=UPI0039E95B60
MTKKVISFRLSDADIADLDELCVRLKYNRSEVISEAIALLMRDYTHDGGRLVKRTPWLASMEDGKIEGA